ncbi:mannitol 1-phosphate dehydrogenase [Lecanosticta acicola]|uniref:Mannitol 1-phosphate dehydrogenase n=1 Tax=Lecanosticta acicola TaxID=111012 RepID=A0AAI8Z3U3_9PEZI|nr:mannitol 1-phosphate dehydrogenase [Lecanosticta acicola]
MSAQGKLIDVVIGGIAGLTTADQLQKYPHVNVQIYESAHKFGEVGDGAVLGPNSQSVMSRTDHRIKEGYDRRAAFDENPPDENGLYPWITLVKGQAPHIGEQVIQFKHKEKSSTIQRAHFLNELVKLIDMDRAHFGKRLDRIYETDDKISPIILHCKNRTTATADVVIGADGIHADIRKHVLGPQDPGADALFTGTVRYRATVPFKKAEEKLGKFEQSPGQLCGTGGSVFGFPLSNTTLYYIGVTVSNNGPWQQDKWAVHVNLDDTTKQFSDWDDYTRKIVELLPTDGSTMAWSVWEMPPASTYFKGRVVITEEIKDAGERSTALPN